MPYAYERLSEDDAAVVEGLGAPFSDSIPNYRNPVTSDLARK